MAINVSRMFKQNFGVSRTEKMVIAVLAIVVVAFAAAWFYKKNPEFFTDAVAGVTRVASQPVVTYYYMAQCPHCINFMPEWEKFTKLAAKDNITTRKVEATPDNSEEMNKLGIKGYPTVIIEKNGQKTEYSGPREADALLAAAKSG